jgi:cytidine deaminase
MIIIWDPSLVTVYPNGVQPADRELWHASAELLARTYRTGRHEVAAAIRTRSGAIFTGVHLAGSAGRSSICAEGMALGATLAGTALAGTALAGTALAGAQEQRTDLSVEVDSLLAVLYRPDEDGGTLRVIAPCGVCRELLFDYCPTAWIYVHRWSGPRPAGVVIESGEPAGFSLPVRAADGQAVRVRVDELLPEKNPRRW